MCCSVYSPCVCMNGTEMGFKHADWDLLNYTGYSFNNHICRRWVISDIGDRSKIDWYASLRPLRWSWHPVLNCCTITSPVEDPNIHLTSNFYNKTSCVFHPLSAPDSLYRAGAPSEGVFECFIGLVCLLKQNLSSLSQFQVSETPHCPWMNSVFSPRTEVDYFMESKQHG